MNHHRPDTHTLLSLLWIFLTLNYIYCDVFALYYAPTLEALLTGKVGDMVVSESFLLIFSAVMEIPLVMILLSRYLPVAINRPVNMVAAVLLAAIHIWSMLGGATASYLFFSVIELAALAAIVVVAFRWQRGAVVSQGVAA